MVRAKSSENLMGMIQVAYVDGLPVLTGSGKKYWILAVLRRESNQCFLAEWTLYVKDRKLDAEASSFEQLEEQICYPLGGRKLQKEQVERSLVFWTPLSMRRPSADAEQIAECESAIQERGIGRNEHG